MEGFELLNNFANFVDITADFFKKSKRKFIKQYREINPPDIYALLIQIKEDETKGDGYYRLIPSPVSKDYNLSKKIRKVIDADSNNLYVIFESQNTFFQVYKLTRKNKVV